MLRWLIVMGAFLGGWVLTAGPVVGQPRSFGRQPFSPQPLQHQSQPGRGMLWRGYPTQSPFGYGFPSSGLPQGIQLGNMSGLLVVPGEGQPQQSLLTAPFTPSSQAEMLQTGHPVVFQNTFQYFPPAGAPPWTLPAMSNRGTVMPLSLPRTTGQVR